MRTEVKVSGFGGQGVITLGKMLTRGAIQYQNLSAVQTSAYGVAARGGSCWTEIVISDEDIDYPRVRRPDYLIILSQDAAYEYGEEVKEGGTVLYDPSTVQDLPSWEDATVYRVPASKMSQEKLDSPLSANIIVLGVFIALTDLMSRKDAEEIIKDSFPEDTIDANMRALEFGLSLEEDDLLEKS